MGNELEKAYMLPLLKTNWLGRHYTFFEEVDSTNTQLKSASYNECLPEGALFIADYQNAGKGRHQRKWIAPSGSGLLFSILFRPDWDVERSAWLMMIGCLAAAQSIGELTNLDVKVKWPNDLVLLQNGVWHKFTGILVEGELNEAGRLKTAVYGMGINVNLEKDDLPDAITPPTSLKIVSGQAIDRSLLLSLILQKMEALYDQTKQGYSPVADWRKLLITLEQFVKVTQIGTGEVLRGTAVDINPYGHLIVKDNLGKTHSIQAGDVTLRPNFDN